MYVCSRLNELCRLLLGTKDAGEGGMIASPSGCVEPSDEQIVVADDSLVSYLIHLLSFFLIHLFPLYSHNHVLVRVRALSLASGPPLTDCQIK